VIIGSVADGITIDSLDKAIALSHYRCLVDFARRTRILQRGGPDLVVMEDDVSFDNEYDAVPEITSVQKMLHRRHPNWATCHLGHLPLGPVLPLGRLCLTTLPFGAHCIMWQRSFVLSIVEKVPPARFRRPMYMEGMLSVSVFRKFTVRRPIATQIIRPKELCQFDQHIPLFGTIAANCSFESLNFTFVVFAIALPLLLAVFSQKLERMGLVLLLLWLPLCMASFAVAYEMFATM
jgi:hypothetical protein